MLISFHKISFSSFCILESLTPINWVTFFSFRQNKHTTFSQTLHYGNWSMILAIHHCSFLHTVLENWPYLSEGDCSRVPSVQLEQQIWCLVVFYHATASLFVLKTNKFVLSRLVWNSLFLTLGTRNFKSIKWWIVAEPKLLRTQEFRLGFLCTQQCDFLKLFFILFW